MCVCVSVSMYECVCEIFVLYINSRAITHEKRSARGLSRLLSIMKLLIWPNASQSCPTRFCGSFAIYAVYKFLTCTQTDV